jgi:flagellar protein FlaG
LGKKRFLDVISFSFPEKMGGDRAHLPSSLFLEDTMAIDISGIGTTDFQYSDSRMARPRPVSAEAQPAVQGLSAPDVDMKSALEELQQVGLAFNKRLQFSLNQKLDTVVVKVIDSQTDKVIKEIPPKELQIVHERIKEAIGLLFDEKI